jgi:hypothetical protein
MSPAKTAHATPRPRTSSRQGATTEPQAAQVQHVGRSTAGEVAEEHVNHLTPHDAAAAKSGPPPDPLLAGSVVLASLDEYEQEVEEATRREFLAMEQAGPDDVILRAARLQWCLHHLRPQALVADGNEEYALVRG